MAEAASEQNHETGKTALEKDENTASDHLTTQEQDMAKGPTSNKTKSENPSTHNKDKSAKQKSGNSPPQTSQKPTKIPVKSSGKQSKKSAEMTTKKNLNSNVKVQNEISSKNDRKSPNNIGTALKTREALESELLEKTEQIDTLQKQLNDLKEVYDAQRVAKMQPKSEETTNPPANKQNTTNSEDVERKVTLLSNENYDLRERLLQKDVEIEKLKTANDEPKVQENIVQKILRKENVELHHEKEELKLERDRLRHLLSKEQEKAGKLVAGLRETEDQLFHAKRALEDKAKASTRLQDRLAKIDSELNRYRDCYGILETQDKTKRVSEKQRSSRSRSLSPGGKKRFESEQECSQNQMVKLQQREAKLLDDRRQLEKSVYTLNNTITELEGKLRKCRSEKRPTLERSSQTELGASTHLTSTMIQGQEYQGNSGVLSGKKGTVGDEMRKCRGIVQSLGKFFEELIQNNQELSSGGSKSRRTTIAARRAQELLHELSISMENALSAKYHEQEPNRAERSTCTKTRAPSAVRRSTAVNTDSSRTLWDKLCDEVANHEFVFDPLSPPLQTKQTSAVTNDKELEIKRAERGLQRVNKGNNNEESGDKDRKEEFTQEDATRMMNVGRKQTESVVKELLRKHQGEIRALLENASQSSPIPNVPFSTNDPEMRGQDEATMAVKELDCFKTRTTKVQSLILKLQEIVEAAKKDKQSAELKLQNLAEEIRQKDTLLQAKSLELRRRHGRTLESEKALQAQIGTLKDEKAAILKENARLHEICRQKDLQMLQKVEEIKHIQKKIDEQENVHQQNLGRMRNKVQEAWGLYESVKSRAEKRTAEFSEAAEKLKASQGHLLDLWQTLKTVDNVVEANEHNEL